MKRTMKLVDIIIPDNFAETTPKENKIKECRQYWNEHHKQDRYIVVDRNNVLSDGYVQYLILKEAGIEEAEIRIGKRSKVKQWQRMSNKDWWDEPEYRENPTTYIIGVHPKSVIGREYMWRIPSNWTWVAENVQIGDVVFCRTKHGVAPVIITKIEILDRCPVDYPVKKMCKKTIIRNEKLVE